MSRALPSTPTVAGRRFSLARVRSIDRVNLALGVVLLISAGFYMWIAGISMPYSLHDGSGDRYNLLATAFLHLRLSIGPAPAALMHLANPYNPAQIATVPNGTTDATSINDDAMYDGQLYFIWGPAPALVLLVPLHLLGFEPSASVTVAVYSIVGLAFALATLRVLIRQVGDGLPTWMCVLAGFTLSLASVIPFLLRTPTITMDTLAGGYCFTMAGIWLAISALATRQASTVRLVAMSLCFGLAANSRPTLWLTAVVLVPVYLALRRTRPRRGLLISLALPVSVCFALFLAYNQARFDDPLEIGSRHQLAGYESTTAPLGRLGYVPSGGVFYALTPPRPAILFPFLHLKAPTDSGPAGLATSEPTGGLLPMAPIVVFIAALPWIWRRRRDLLGWSAVALMALAGVGIVIPLLDSYQFYASTERYEVDFATLLVLGGLAAWLSLSKATSGYRRRLLRLGGGLLAGWSCVAGFAVCFYGSDPELALTHPGTWRTLEDIGSPLSTAITAALGHPVLGAITGGHEEIDPASYTGLSNPVVAFTLSPNEHANLTVVSPYGGNATLVAEMERVPGAAIRIDGPGHVRTSYVPSVSKGEVAIPLKLGRGLNYLTLSPIVGAVHGKKATEAALLLADLRVT